MIKTIIHSQVKLVRLPQQKLRERKTRGILAQNLSRGPSVEGGEGNVLTVLASREGSIPGPPLPPR